MRQVIQPGRDFKWSDRSWTHNMFRCFEMIFGRRWGIRAEMSCGNGFIQLHSFESAVAYTETLVRQFLASFKIPQIRVYVPAYAPLGALPSSSPYLFAIAFDNSARSTESNSATNTYSHTCTGSNLALIGYGTIENSTSNIYTAFTYNGVSLLSNAITSTSNSPRFLGAWSLTAPATGANTVSTTITGGGFHQEATSSYSGVNQSSPIDGTNTGTSASATTLALSVTPNSTNCSGNNCWVACASINNSTSITTLSPGAFRQGGAAPIGTGDSNGTITSGSSNTQTFGTGGSNATSWAGVIFSITPAGSAAVRIPFLSLLGIGY